MKERKREQGRGTRGIGQTRKSAESCFKLEIRTLELDKPMRLNLPGFTSIKLLITFFAFFRMNGDSTWETKGRFGTGNTRIVKVEAIRLADRGGVAAAAKQMGCAGWEPCRNWVGEDMEGQSRVGGSLPNCYQRRW